MLSVLENVASVLSILLFFPLTQDAIPKDVQTTPLFDTDWEKPSVSNQSATPLKPFEFNPFDKNPIQKQTPAKSSFLKRVLEKNHARILEDCSQFRKDYNNESNSTVLPSVRSSPRFEKGPLGSPSWPNAHLSANPPAAESSSEYVAPESPDITQSDSSLLSDNRFSPAAKLNEKTPSNNHVLHQKAPSTLVLEDETSSKGTPKPSMTFKTLEEELILSSKSSGALSDLSAKEKPVYQEDQVRNAGTPNANLNPSANVTLKSSKKDKEGHNIIAGTPKALELAQLNGSAKNKRTPKPLVQEDKITKAGTPNASLNRSSNKEFLKKSAKLATPRTFEMATLNLSSKKEGHTPKSLMEVEEKKAEVRCALPNATLNFSATKGDVEKIATADPETFENARLSVNPASEPAVVMQVCSEEIATSPIPLENGLSSSLKRTSPEQAAQALKVEKLDFNADASSASRGAGVTKELFFKQLDQFVKTAQPSKSEKLIQFAKAKPQNLEQTSKSPRRRSFKTFSSPVRRNVSFGPNVSLFNAAVARNI
jgi:hypothetical protein